MYVFHSYCCCYIVTEALVQAMDAMRIEQSRTNTLLTTMHNHLTLVDASFSSPSIPIADIVVPEAVVVPDAIEATTNCRHNGAYYVGLWNASLAGTNIHIVGSNRQNMNHLA